MTSCLLVEGKDVTGAAPCNQGTPGCVQPEHNREYCIAGIIENWHIKPESWREGEELHEHLGWTWLEYKLWVEKRILPPPRDGAA
jgi:hypothetical protein